MRRRRTVSMRVKYVEAQSTFAGVRFRDSNGTPPVTVSECNISTDAYRKGVREGDTVVAIDGESVGKGMPYQPLYTNA